MEEPAPGVRAEDGSNVRILWEPHNHFVALYTWNPSRERVAFVSEGDLNERLDASLYLARLDIPC